RSLWRWQPGMDENEHKALLDQSGGPKRWVKTNPAGWFGRDLDQLSDCLILVEGAFDRLALLAAGFQAAEVVALVGTALQVDWFPYQVKSVVLALDGDAGGLDAMYRLADHLARTGLCVSLCPPVQDGYGKDWNERWRRLGPRSLSPIYEVYTHLLRSA
ncbi:MAG TPA: toprim domain-containing protein, partial [Ktedonobacteraceae bacterium]